MSTHIKGLYAIADTALIPPHHLIDAVEQAIQGGARLIQYRDKSKDFNLRYQQALALQATCQRYQVPLIINDDMQLAQQVQAAGVHLGRDDVTIEIARAKLGHTAIIGISCYNQLSLAMAAVDNGASYVAFGRFFPSQTKPEAVHASLELLQQAHRQLTCPIVAIGGITPDNATPLLQAGADSLAVIQGLFAHSNIRLAAYNYASLFN